MLRRGQGQPNLGILSVFARSGAGFDIILGRRAGARATPAARRQGGVLRRRKTRAEMRQALQGHRCFNVESAAELEPPDAVAGELGKRAPVPSRVNPDRRPQDPPLHLHRPAATSSASPSPTHTGALPQGRRGAANLRITGVACHIGSQSLTARPSPRPVTELRGLVEGLAADGIALEHIDLGGGLGIRYRDETPPPVNGIPRPLLEVFAEREEELCFEPGRSLVGNAGPLLTRIEYPCRAKRRTSRSSMWP